ncbi:hypothetical protein [Aliiroseovarius crassostreae]|uniref:hypothetical protein n=1 Tax=Aliiroseovarius crassostreae TaxID=154981 RepID=UPI003C79CED1
MLETPDLTEMHHHYQRAHALRAQAFRDLFTLRWLRLSTWTRPIKKRAATSRPAVHSCPA